MDELTIEQARRLVAETWTKIPRVGIVLGSGLGNLVDGMEVQAAFPFEVVPGFCKATVEGHAGRLICGLYQGVPVVALQGRFHQYEGYSAAQRSYPIRLMHRLGIRQLIVSNAAGGLDPRFAPGDIMVITDHIRGFGFRGAEPGRGSIDQRGETRSHLAVSSRGGSHTAEPVYDLASIEVALQAARSCQIPVRQGVYLALSGPTFETRAEYRMLREWGADAVGMSTVPEAIVAHQLRLAVLGLSVITNVAHPGVPTSTSGHQVLTVAHNTEARMSQLVAEIVRSLSEQRRFCEE